MDNIDVTDGIVKWLKLKKENLAHSNYTPEELLDNLIEEAEEVEREYGLLPWDYIK